MKLINVGHWLIIHSFAVVLAQLHGEVFLFRRMEERTNFRLVAAKLVAGDAFVFVRVIKPFHSGVAFVALEAFRTLVPTHSLGQDAAVLRSVLEYFRRSPKIAHVVRVNAGFAIVTVFFGWAPGCLIHEHIEHKSIFVYIELLQVIV